METIIVIALLMASLVYNMHQYKVIKKCGCMTEQPKKQTAYKKSWSNGGKANKKWSNDK